MAAGNDAGGLARRDLLLGLGIGMGALALPVATAKPARAQGEPSEEIVVYGGQEIPDPPRDPGGLIEAKAAALDLYTMILQGAGVILMIGGVLVGVLSGGTIFIGALSLVLVGGIAYYWAGRFADLASDPPQPAYKIAAFVKPWSVHLPPTKSADPYRKFLRAGNVGVPTVRGMIDSLERMQGADAAGDTRWVRQHWLGLEIQNGVEIRELQRAAAGLEEIANIPNSDRPITPRMMAQGKQTLLDPNIRQQMEAGLANAGLTADQISGIYEYIVAFNPSAQKTTSLKSVCTRMGREMRSGSQRLLNAL